MQQASSIWENRLGELEPKVLDGTATAAETAEFRRLAAEHEAWVKTLPEYQRLVDDLTARGFLPPADTATGQGPRGTTAPSQADQEAVR